MRVNLHFCAVSLSMGLIAGCATHPLPENVTAFDTKEIVFQIRCEARAALKDATIAFLTNSKLEIPQNTRAAAADLAAGTTRFADFDPKALDPATSGYLQKYESAAIAYDFTFNIVEDNSAGVDLDFLSKWTKGTVGLNFKVNNDRQRQTIRNFRIVDNFGSLRKYRRCPKITEKTPNLVYPVTGTIGLDELVKTFVDLNEFQNLAGKDEKNTVPVLADTFHFVTTMGASVAPSIGYTPVTTKFHLSRASGGPVGATRTDTHQVIVAVSLDPKKSRHLGAPLSVPIIRLNTTLAGAGTSGAEQRALLEIDNQKTINSLNNIALKGQ